MPTNLPRKQYFFFYFRLKDKSYFFQTHECTINISMSTAESEKRASLPQRKQPQGDLSNLQPQRKSTCLLLRSLVFHLEGWHFMKIEGTHVDNETRWKRHLPNHRVTASPARFHPTAMQLCWTHKALMCSTYKAMMCFLCFCLSGSLLHIHEGQAHAHPEAIHLFRLG